MWDPWVGKIPGEGKGYPLQYSGLENFMDYKVYGVAKSQTWLSDLHFHFSLQACRCLKAFALSVPSDGKSIHPTHPIPQSPLGFCSNAPLQWGLRGVKDLLYLKCNISLSFYFPNLLISPPHLYLPSCNFYFYSSCLSSLTKTVSSYPQHKARCQAQNRHSVNLLN